MYVIKTIHVNIEENKTKPVLREKEHIWMFYVSPFI